nr:hypothetical protein [bacterium]
MIDQFTPSWYSGMAQGRALNLLSMLYEITGRKQYLEAADHTFDSILSLQTLNDDPWISTIDENNYFWIEEYPTDEPAHVLNGFIFALYGIYEYWIQTESELAEILLNRSIKTLKDHLDLYRRPGEVSKY